MGKWKNECDKWDVQGRKNGVTIENSLHLLLEVMCLFEVLEFTIVWMQRVQLKNYNK
jgi:hypothetical protein